MKLTEYANCPGFILYVCPVVHAGFKLKSHSQRRTLNVPVKIKGLVDNPFIMQLSFEELEFNWSAICQTFWPCDRQLFSDPAPLSFYTGRPKLRTQI